MEPKDIEAKPFLKWAGGKRQLIDVIESFLPHEIKESKKIDKYFEPFVGGGALFFHLEHYYDINKSYLFDINKELILTYNVIQKDPIKLINELKILSDEFLPKETEERKEFYYNIRSKFNDTLEEFDYDNYSDNHIERASFTIFMNKTDFNGLFRLNKDGKFNVPFGRYKNPLICDESNIKAVSKALQNVNIYNSNYFESEKFIDNSSLVYLDPPYRPLTKTSNFTTYAGGNFTDRDQIKLSEFYKRISYKGAKALLSNSDPKNVDLNDNFFDDLYSEFTIERVQANRSINSKGSKRGKINEILVRNY